MNWLKCNTSPKYFPFKNEDLAILFSTIVQ